MNPRRLSLIAGVAALVFVLDRISKNAVVDNIPLGGSREFLGSYVRFIHTQNSGAAFGLLPERTTVLSVLSVVAVLAILYYYRRIAGRSPLIAATLGMQLGGAVGNFVDRVSNGYVVDFIDVGVGSVRYWTFNVADSAIVSGIIIVIGLLWLEERKAQAGPAAG